MQFQVTIDYITIIADEYIPIPEELAVQFYKDKFVLDHIPPIKVNANLLSDFGNSILCGKKEKNRE